MKTKTAFEFEIGKSYQLINEHEFKEYSAYNEKIYNLIGKNPFKVLALGPGNRDVVLISINGKEYTPSDFDSQLTLVISKYEVEYFNEVVVPSARVVLVQILNGVETSSVPLDEESAHKSIEAFLTKNPTGKVEMYTLDKTAQLTISYKEHL